VISCSWQKFAEDRGLMLRRRRVQHVQVSACKGVLMLGAVTHGFASACNGWLIKRDFRRLYKLRCPRVLSELPCLVAASFKP
jgi:hypothetical protein